MTMTSVELITQRELAPILGKSEKTLAKWRADGIGPTYIRVGRGVRYRPADVEQWLEANTIPARLEAAR